MLDNKRKVLVLVEGAKTDTELMRKLFSLYQIDVRYEIVAYCTNIYTLYGELFADNDPEVVDLLQVLKSREHDADKKQIFDVAYSDILLIFDLDPQAPDYSAEKIRRMANYFSESSDMGKLYINYPMVEAFYHMVTIPDENYFGYYATIAELKAGKYKERVNRENRNHDYRKFVINKEECNYVILQNIKKAQKLVNMDSENEQVPTQGQILEAQMSISDKKNKIAILCTCIFFIADYNIGLIRE